MPNLHSEHPEDLLLTGETWAIDALFSSDNIISLKMDGAPAVVWGIHPQTGKFFVGTKSVFNKRLIKINYTHSDIIKNHKQDNVRRILAACLSYLPRTEGVFQGDFIGFGGTDTYTPNTLTYKFNRVVTQNIIIAPHTEYHVPGELKNAQAGPLMTELNDTCTVKFVTPMVDRVPLDNPWHVDHDQITFLTEKEASQAKVGINALIRSGQEVTVEDLTGIIGNQQLAVIYYLVIRLKQQVLQSVVVYNAPQTFIGDKKVLGEGVFFHTEEGSFKVVDRYEFSLANFTNGRFQK